MDERCGWMNNNSNNHLEMTSKSSLDLGERLWWPKPDQIYTIVVSIRSFIMKDYLLLYEKASTSHEYKLVIRMNAC